MSDGYHTLRIHLDQDNPHRSKVEVIETGHVLFVDDLLIHVTNAGMQVTFTMMHPFVEIVTKNADQKDEIV